MTFYQCSLNRPQAERLEVLAGSTGAAARDFADAMLVAELDAELHGAELDVRVCWPHGELPDEIWRVERFEGQTLARLVAVKTRRTSEVVDLWAIADNVGL